MVTATEEKQSIMRYKKYPAQWYTEMLESVAWAGLPEKVTVEKTSEESEQ